MTISSSARVCSATSPPRTNSPMRFRRAAAWCFQVLNRTGFGTSQGEPVANGGVVVALMAHLPLTKEWQEKKDISLRFSGSPETPYKNREYRSTGVLQRCPPGLGIAKRLRWAGPQNEPPAAH